VQKLARVLKYTWRAVTRAGRRWRVGWPGLCASAEAISRTVIHKTITTRVAISTAVFEIGLHCEDKAGEGRGESDELARNVSRVETLGQFRETTHSASSSN